MTLRPEKPSPANKNQNKKRPAKRKPSKQKPTLTLGKPEGLTDEELQKLAQEMFDNLKN